MKPKNILQMEFIGLNVEITDSKNKQDIGNVGKIINETKNTFVIDVKGKIKTFLKQNIHIKVKINDELYIINCEGLLKRPHERIKVTK